MNKTDNSPLVSVAWLVEHLGHENLSIVDGSWYMAASGRAAAAEFKAAHIPGAVLFEIDTIADRTTDLPHMVAGPKEFAEAVGALGISERDTIVVYDGSGLFSAARVWWNFKIMGAAKVFVLDGGLPAWISAGHPTVAGVADRKARVFQARFEPSLVFDSADIQAGINLGRQVVDVRPAPRFTGAAPDPRPGLRTGHMPGSANLPFPTLIEDGRLVSPERITALLNAAGVDTSKPLVTTCGSGVTAPILNLALARIGVNAMEVYDGSWTDWGGNDALPVEVGPAKG
ncbi:MAG: 3-mercaptopyruvate sulfurtransferase [Alphaproteobacteria bacterium]|nr:3-mercaptopyruvate sulfurtransferase [Alphaproteobacteria bacterium]